MDGGDLARSGLPRRIAPAVGKTAPFAAAGCAGDFPAAAGPTYPTLNAGQKTKTPGTDAGRGERNSCDENNSERAQN